MKKEDLKIAVIGCGHWGKNLVRNFSEIGVLEAVCDQSEDVAEKFAAQYGVKALGWDAILKQESSIDGVVIAAPAILHYKLAHQALAAGKHVFVEKPLSLNVNEAEFLCDLAEEKNLTLMVGHLLHYHPGFIKLKEMVANGELGKLQYIYSNRANLGKIRREENILWSFAPHDISMILALAGEEPDDVDAVGANFLDNEIYDVTTTHLSFSNGIRSHIFVSWLHPFKEQKLVVVGDQAMAVFDDLKPKEEKLTLYNHKIHWEDGMPVPEKSEGVFVALDDLEPLKNECEHFLNCIVRGEQPTTDGREGIRVLNVLQNAQIALQTASQNRKKNSITRPDLEYFVHETALVDDDVSIGEGSKIWHFSHILSHTTIGENCVLGQNVMAGPNVQIGNDCKIQNNVSVYKGVTLEDGVFCGPSCVFTNVENPRAEIERKSEFKETLVKRGATIGANATILCGLTIGEYAFIGAGAVVTKDVPDFALMVGNPAQQIGWMSRAGARLGEDLTCPIEKIKYSENKDGTLTLKQEKKAA